MKNFIIGIIILIIATFISSTLLEPYNIDLWPRIISYLLLFYTGMAWQYLWNKDRIEFQKGDIILKRILNNN